MRTLRVALVVAAGVVMVASGCAPPRASQFVAGYSGLVATNDPYPPGGETIMTMQNLSDERISPVLVRVAPGAEVSARTDLTSAIAPTVAAFGTLEPRVAGDTGNTPTIDQGTVHVHLDDGTYVLLPDGYESFVDGTYLAFEIRDT